MKSEFDFLSEMAWNSRAINQSPNTYKRSLRHWDIIKHVLTYLFDALGYMNITLTKCVFVQTRQVCHSPDLSKNAMRHNSKAITPRQLSLFFKADVLSAGRPTSASCSSETSCGCVISTYIFQNQNWPDILFAVLINLHTTSDISMHCTCWWPSTVDY